MVKDFAKAGLALNVAALSGDIFQTGVKQRFVGGKKGIGGGGRYRRRTKWNSCR